MFRAVRTNVAPALGGDGSKRIGRHEIELRREARAGVDIGFTVDFVGSSEPARENDDGLFPSLPQL
jgi:hypothetical protein